jgi:hypothetical protein
MASQSGVTPRRARGRVASGVLAALSAPSFSVGGSGLLSISLHGGWTDGSQALYRYIRGISRWARNPMYKAAALSTDGEPAVIPAPTVAHQVCGVEARAFRPGRKRRSLPSMVIPSNMRARTKLATECLCFEPPQGMRWLRGEASGLPGR